MILCTTQYVVQVLVVLYYKTTNNHVLVSVYPALVLSDECLMDASCQHATPACSPQAQGSREVTPAIMEPRAGARSSAAPAQCPHGVPNNTPNSSAPPPPGGGRAASSDRHARANCFVLESFFGLQNPLQTPAELIVLKYTVVPDHKN